MIALIDLQGGKCYPCLCYLKQVTSDNCDEAIQLMGGYGYMQEYEVERFYRDAKITEFYEGTKEIQKNTIASALIGKIK